jgi:aspartyl-tRNA(Asn)/glutamyl-tRNA(Gln) amidotransferase subunit C
MSISLDEVRHVARLSRLNLDETEMMSLQGELNALLGHFSDIEAVVTTGIDPSSSVVTIWNAWSEDVPRSSLPRIDVLRNAPVSKAGLFVVPMIIEE